MIMLMLDVYHKNNAHRVCTLLSLQLEYFRYFLRRQLNRNVRHSLPRFYFYNQSS